ncbi:zinc finger protein castor homolog 1 isoform X1 [Lates japonicus]|uniref:Zinc finger protein castor homolog 1 isoform X1 n=1 Tax=Lates japonicus TaxID=270547 RepID=A0AAD3M1Q0_LATJO|nr:zinc finger protein castor homolog 1 isoform X1 [Lates japonicus]
MRGHYHCLRPGCFFVTNITTKLPWHIKKHEKAERRAANGFKYFTKREECGRLGLFVFLKLRHSHRAAITQKMNSKVICFSGGYKSERRNKATKQVPK